ncbi:Uncharacterised protein [Moraxella ovis]|uniref:Uncharacterized protein n=1 Tax=Moraxella ovis TaxID=29433 RepID=A0A378QCH7_9GAMM|nr:Uncharacterised protein [Moraxella ovis]
MRYFYYGCLQTIPFKINKLNTIFDSFVYKKILKCKQLQALYIKTCR